MKRSEKIGVRGNRLRGEEVLVLGDVMRGQALHSLTRTLKFESPSSSCLVKTLSHGKKIHRS